ncbi:I78 family peptidase inhibitor [Pseudogemmobacter bohemicus]|uniref:I78 family peptidase inhibitor n=1 Tax=Pseudogemmobacter bohemicus TaxID=2250708 RepID=UPI0013003DF9|nr:I78 family peptidase inhibitor [Pseudogemmobacter bohemicus]
MFALVSRFAALALILAACSPPAVAPRPVAVPASTRPALTERTPDTCRLAALSALQGQPAGNLRTVRLAGVSRIIPPGGIVDQTDYIPQRINAYIDDQGIITRLECG